MLNGKNGLRSVEPRADDMMDASVRRRWSVADKARVVADSLAPGVGASEAARRWHVGRRQVYAWRREAQAGLLALPPELSGVSPPDPAFVPIVAEPVSLAAASPAQPAVARASASVPVIEVEIAGAVVRVSPGMDDGLLAAVLRAVRASVASA